MPQSEMITLAHWEGNKYINNKKQLQGSGSNQPPGHREPSRYSQWPVRACSEVCQMNEMHNMWFNRNWWKNNATGNLCFTQDQDHVSSCLFDSQMWFPEASTSHWFEGLTILYMNLKLITSWKHSFILQVRKTFIKTSLIHFFHFKKGRRYV